MALATANKSAFEAYNVLYYPLFGEQGTLNVSPGVAASANPSDADLAYAITAQENLIGTPYSLSDRAIAALAQFHAVMDKMFNVSSNEGVAAAMLIDPATDIRSFMPEPGRPMYPDFPSQVLEMDEDDFRLHQARHYMSTYGTMIIGAFTGAGNMVGEGWQPDAPETEKAAQDSAETPRLVVDIAFSAEDVNALLDVEMSRPKRMSAPALDLAVHQMVEHGFEPSSIAFHENAKSLIAACSDRPSADIALVAGKLCQHPGDVFKSALWIAERNGRGHLTTAMKKAYCAVLETYGSDAIARNLVDNGSKVRRSANLLSVKRFGGANLVKAVYDVEKGVVRSWNSQLEGLWKAHSEDPSIRNSRALLSFYGQRPGIMLRSVGRMVAAGIDDDEISNALMSHADDFSMATLVTLQTVMSSLDSAEASDWRGRSESERKDERFADRQAMHAKIAKLTLPILMEKMSKLDTPLRGKSVWVDTCGFSLAGSVILPNETGETGTAYPPSGMAYDVPADAMVRFFTFWDERRRNVDVDLHFHARRADGGTCSIGWNSEFKENGMVTSGDITSSIDSAEYLDVDMAEAAKCEVETILQYQHIYSGAENWKDITTCFSGALVVPEGSAGKDKELYSSENVLFHDDMTGDGSSMNYAMVDVPNHYVRIMRGISIPFRRNAFTLELFVNLLLRTQGCSMAEDAESADIVLSIGRSDDKDAVSLIDNGFFIH